MFFEIFIVVSNLQVDVENIWKIEKKNMVFYLKANQVYLIDTQAPKINIVYNIPQIATALIWSS